ncbi:MAG: TPM domain-containing protein [Kiritimatiellae bacterium]|nr:TPM domain-containing protein [Kiritimatiellia bacterium]
MRVSIGQKGLLIGVLAVWALVWQASAQDQTDFDRLLDSLPYEAQVTDQAGVLSIEDRDTLEKKLTDYRLESGNEVAVALISSLQGGQIDDFGNKLFAKWELGDADKDNGLLVLAAIEDRKMRIEVGYGLEGVLPDAACGRIRDQYLAPAFREGKYAKGLNDAVDAFIRAIGGTDAEGSESEDGAPVVVQPISGGGKLLIMLFFVVVVVVIIVLGNKFGGRTGGGSSSGGSRSGGSSSSGSSGFSGGGGGSSGGGGASGSW